MRHSKACGRANNVSYPALFVLTCLTVAVTAPTQPVWADPFTPHHSRSFVHPSTDQVALPMRAWIRFCERHPRECVVDLQGPRLAQLTRDTWQTIVRINREVNESIRPQTDREHWGVGDRWTFAEDGYGDCEDFQLVKRRRLVEAGLPRRALLMTVVTDETGSGHAVLMVRTSGGDLILDNKRNAALPWHQTGYTFVKREADDGAGWAWLGVPASQTVATAQ